LKISSRDRPTVARALARSGGPCRWSRPMVALEPRPSILHPAHRQHKPHSPRAGDLVGTPNLRGTGSHLTTWCRRIADNRGTIVTVDLGRGAEGRAADGHKAGRRIQAE